MIKYETEEHLRLDIVEYFNGSLSEKEASALLRYLSANSWADKIFKEMSAMWALSSTSAFADQADTHYAIIRDRIENKASKETHSDQPVARKRHFPSWIMYAAAALAAIFLISDVVLLKKNKEIKETYTQVTQPYCIQVPEGCRTDVGLPDGTIVTLNSGSSLTYDHQFGIFDRKVILRGEGYFVVAKNPDKPFYVNVDNMSLRVLGTTFNVDAYDDDDLITVSLIEGKVEISNKAGGNLLLFPNERATYNRRSGKIMKESAEVKNSTHWLDGGFTFENESFPAIAHRLERKFGVKIIINSDRLKKQYYTATFSSDKSINDILKEFDVENQYIWKESDGAIIIKDKR